MTQETCPNCQAELPQKLGSGCPNCELEKPQWTLDTTRPLSPVKRVDSRRKRLDGLLIIGSLAAVCGIALAAIRNDWVEAIYTGGLWALVIICGTIWSRKRSGNRGSNSTDRDGTKKDPRQFSVLGLILAGCAIGVGLLIGGTQYSVKQPDTTKVDVLGINDPGDYRNPHFGFRLRYGDDWQDMTNETRKQVSEKSDVRVESTFVMLALTRPSEANQQNGTSVTFMAEFLPMSKQSINGSDYLAEVLTVLRQRRDRPRQVKEETQVVIAGLTFDRVSLIRSWGGGDIRMTYWVAVKNGYALVITASYFSLESLKGIEGLIASCETL